VLSSLALHSDQVIPARAQMGSSLGFHIILACMGIGFPAVVMTAHYLGLRGDADALLLARRWSKVMAALVAVGRRKRGGAVVRHGPAVAGTDGQVRVGHRHPVQL
jgi:hypothetical protein